MITWLAPIYLLWECLDSHIIDDKWSY